MINTHLLLSTRNLGEHFAEAEFLSLLDDIAKGILKEPQDYVLVSATSMGQAIEANKRLAALPAEMVYTYILDETQASTVATLILMRQHHKVVDERKPVRHNVPGSGHDTPQAVAVKLPAEEAAGEPLAKPALSTQAPPELVVEPVYEAAGASENQLLIADVHARMDLLRYRQDSPVLAPQQKQAMFADFEKRGAKWFVGTTEALNQLEIKSVAPLRQEVMKHNVNVTRKLIKQCGPAVPVSWSATMEPRIEAALKRYDDVALAFLHQAQLALLLHYYGSRPAADAHPSLYAQFHHAEPAR